MIAVPLPARVHRRGVHAGASPRPLATMPHVGLLFFLGVKRERRCDRACADDARRARFPSRRGAVCAEARRPGPRLGGLGLALRVGLEHVVAVGLAQLVEGPGLDLAHALARDAEDVPDLLEGLGLDSPDDFERFVSIDI